MSREPVPLTVLGAGDVVINRYLPAAAAPGAGVRIDTLIDVRAEAVISAAAKKSGNYGHVKVVELPGGSTSNLISYLRANQMYQPVVIATPTPDHVEYAVSLLAEGFTVAIEKPFALNRAQVSRLESCDRGALRERLFLLGYYALEKGLPAFCLGLSDSAPSSYRHQLVPSPGASMLAAIRQELGALRAIRGVLLEGRGSAGELGHRSWVLDPRNGGNTLETFYHLICMTSPFVDLRTVEINDVLLACHAETDEWYREKFGRPAAETMTFAALRLPSGTQLRFICGKYVGDDLHERWVEMEFDHGRAFMDFESARLQIDLATGPVTFSLKSETKYATQFALLSEKIHDPTSRTELSSFRDALLCTLSIREQGMLAGIKKYRTSDIRRATITDFLSAGTARIDA